MIRAIALGGLWLGFVGYAFLFAPPEQPGTFELIQRLSMGDWVGINPFVPAIFNAMGILPTMYGAMLFLDGRGQKLPAWLFAFGSFLVGAFALLPYLAFRQENRQFLGRKNWWLRWQDSRFLGAFCLLALTGLVGYGVTQGDWSDYVALFQGDRFIHVMSLDFCVLSLLLPTVVKDDLARRGLDDRGWIFWAIALTPPLGTAVYLTLRPPTIETPDTPEP